MIDKAGDKFETNFSRPILLVTVIFHKRIKYDA